MPTPAAAIQGLAGGCGQMRPHLPGAHAVAFTEANTAALRPLIGKLCWPLALKHLRPGDVCVPSCLRTLRKFEELQLPLSPA